MLRIKNKNAFTLVEMLVVITVIAILSSIAVATFEGSRQDARNSTRAGNITIISEALEKYYESNGEYPSVVSIANNTPGNTGTVVATKLSISTKALIMPKMPTSATNAITSDVTPHDDYISYVASKASDNANCQSSATGGCDEFTLKYYEEPNTLKTLKSRHF